MSGNSKRMGKIVVVFCIAALTAFAGIAQANTGEWGGHHKRPAFARIAKKLGLTDDQKAQAKAIFKANREAEKPVYDSLRAERKNLRALMQADTIDEAAIRSETTKIAGIQADLNVNRAKVGAQFRAILTPAQLATLKAMREKRRQQIDGAIQAN